MIVSTIRSRSVSANDRLDAHYFTSPGVAASERVTMLAATGTRTERLGDLAKVWDPPRFARAYAAPLEEGMPYLRPYDAFDFLPQASDRLSRLRNSDLDGLTPSEGTILQTCSGRNLGPVTIADAVIASFALSHDMVRIDVDDEDRRAYVFAFLQSPTGQALLRRSRSGSVIDHITAADVAAVPVPLLGNEVQRKVAEVMRRAVADVGASRATLLGVLSRREQGLPAPKVARVGFQTWAQPRSSFVDRLDAGHYEPRVAQARIQLRELGPYRLGDFAEAYLPVRYKRYYVEPPHGRPILSGRQLLQTEPINLRHVSDRSFRDPSLYELSEGMTVFGAVGRSEGRQGVPALISAARHGWLASNDVMRLKPRDGVRPGAVWIAVATRQTRMQINALSFGSVVDHMNPWDVEDVLVAPVSDDEATVVEEAWARFGAASTDMAAAASLCETFLHE